MNRRGFMKMVPVVGLLGLVGCKKKPTMTQAGTWVNGADCPELNQMTGLYITMSHKAMFEMQNNMRGAVCPDKADVRVVVEGVEKIYTWDDFLKRLDFIGGHVDNTGLSKIGFFS